MSQSLCFFSGVSVFKKTFSHFSPKKSHYYRSPPLCADSICLFQQYKMQYRCHDAGHWLLNKKEEFWVCNPSAVLIWNYLIVDFNTFPCKDISRQPWQSEWNGVCKMEEPHMLQTRLSRCTVGGSLGMLYQPRQQLGNPICHSTDS